MSKKILNVGNLYLNYLSIINIEKEVYNEELDLLERYITVSENLIFPNYILLNTDKDSESLYPLCYYRKLYKGKAILCRFTGIYSKNDEYPISLIHKEVPEVMSTTDFGFETTCGVELNELSPEIILLHKERRVINYEVNPFVDKLLSII